MYSVFLFKRASTYNPKLNAFINFNPKAVQQAVELDEYYEKNRAFVGKLHCVPIVVKDNIDVAGMPTTCGVRALRNSIPNKDSTIIERLKYKTFSLILILHLIVLIK